MEREKLEELISAFLDGELEAHELAELHQELSNSEVARRLMKQYRIQQDMLGRMGEAPRPVEFKRPVDRRKAVLAVFGVLLLLALLRC